MPPVCVGSDGSIDPLVCPPHMVWYHNKRMASFFPSTIPTHQWIDRSRSPRLASSPRRRPIPSRSRPPEPHPLCLLPNPPALLTSMARVVASRSKCSGACELGWVVHGPSVKQTTASPATPHHTTPLRYLHGDALGRDLGVVLLDRRQHRLQHQRVPPVGRKPRERRQWQQSSYPDDNATSFHPVSPSPRLTAPIGAARR